MKLTFNERSEIVLSSAGHAVAVLDNFFDVCGCINSVYKLPLNLYYTKSPRHILLHPDFNVENYIYSKEKDDRSRILGYLTRSPVAHEYPFYLIDGKEAKGVGYAYEQDHPCISLETEEKWKQNFLNLTKTQINDDDLVSEEIEHPNVFNRDSVAIHIDLLKKIYQHEQDVLNSSIKSGKEIWLAREKIFPNLVFNEEIEQYLTTLNGGGTFHTLYGRLIEMNDYFGSWTSGDFNRKAFSGNARIESETRIDKFGFKFAFPKGKTYQCSYHCEYYNHGLRLYFFPNPRDHKAYIGYIGKKIGA